MITVNMANLLFVVFLSGAGAFIRAGHGFAVASASWVGTIHF